MEVACLRWDDLDLGDAPTVHVRNPKRGPALTLPLASQAAQILRNLRPVADQIAPGSPWVFPAQSRSKHIEEPHEETVPGGIHDLRREWLSTAAEEGVPLLLAKVAIGHSIGSGDVTAGYMVALDVRGVVQKVADALERRATPVIGETALSMAAE
jgi:integrase